MKTVSVKEMRDHIGAILEEAERGETLVIKRHGREIAKLGPMDVQKEGLPSMESFRKGIQNISQFRGRSMEKRHSASSPLFHPAKKPILHRADTMITPDTLRFRHRGIPGLNQVR